MNWWCGWYDVMWSDMNWWCGYVLMWWCYYCIVTLACIVILSYQYQYQYLYLSAWLVIISSNLIYSDLFYAMVDDDDECLSELSEVQSNLIELHGMKEWMDGRICHEPKHVCIWIDCINLNVIWVKVAKKGKKSMIGMNK